MQHAAYTAQHTPRSMQRAPIESERGSQRPHRLRILAELHERCAERVLRLRDGAVQLYRLRECADLCKRDCASGTVQAGLCKRDCVRLYVGWVSVRTAPAWSPMACSAPPKLLCASKNRPSAAMRARSYLCASCRAFERVRAREAVIGA
jgi:hypothetical protein